MTWRVATKVGTATLEVIDPADWNAYTPTHREGYELVTEFDTEQEADKFAMAQVARALAVLRATNANKRR
jgi:hypothetical protein